MHALRFFLIILIVFQFMDHNQVECEEDSWLSRISRILPLKKKSETPKKSDSWSMFSSSDKEKPKESSSWFKSDKKNDKKSSGNWLPDFKILSNLISSKDLNEIPSNDLSSKNASKSNLSNWELPNFNLTNFNFSFVNVSNWELPKLNTSSLLNFNNSKDWLINLKARYYGNLLDSNQTSFDNQTSNRSNLRSIYTSTIEPTVDTFNGTSTVASIDRHSIASTRTFSINESSNNTSNDTSYYSMNYTLFRDRLIKVYDNLTFCEHPCDTQGKRVKKNINTNNITINGCGPSYFSDRQLTMIPYGEFFKDCCDFHDSKYADCGFQKQEADYSFLDCMLNLINKTSEETNSWPRIQKTFGYALFGMVDLFGCKAWAISQKEVCSCN